MKSRKKLIAAGVAVIVLVGGAWGYTTLKGATPDIDPSRIATVERGTMTKSVVATGKIEPITKVEIKSKANGIIEKMNVDVDQMVRPSDVLVELDKENLRAQVRESHANLQAAKAAQEASAAQLNKATVAAEAPDLEFAKRNYDRAQQLYAQKLVSPQSLDDAKSAMDMAKNRKAGAEVQLGISQAKLSEAAANVAQAQAAVDRNEEQLANATIRAPINGTVLTRDVEVGSPVSSILNMGSAATLVMTLGDISQVFVYPQLGLGRDALFAARLQKPGVGPRNGGRSPHRPRAPRADRAHHRRDVQGPEVRGAGHADLADRRREGQRHDVRGEGLD